MLGPPSSWPSPLLAYRLSDDFQAPWKCELGQWLHCAQTYGFLDRVRHDLEHHARKSVSRLDRHPNDERHLKLHQHLAASRTIHYLTATGWTFDSYESVTGGQIDIDVTLRNPADEIVEIQVKAPGVPSPAGAHAHSRSDEGLKRALTKGVGQLRKPAQSAALVVICANYDRPLSWSSHRVSRFAIGKATCQAVGACSVRPEDEGLFFTIGWKHMSGIVMLDVAFGEADTLYPCTVLLNPCADLQIVADSFPHARVLELRGDRFRWIHGEPQHPFFPDGTRLGRLG